jgi:hypothetical protein
MIINNYNKPLGAIFKEYYPFFLVNQKISQIFNYKWSAEKVKKMQAAYWEGIQRYKEYHPQIPSSEYAPLIKYMAETTGYTLAHCIAFAQTQFEMYKAGTLKGAWVFWTGEKPKAAGEYFVEDVKADIEKISSEMKKRIKFVPTFLWILSGVAVLALYGRIRGR